MPAQDFSVSARVESTVVTLSVSSERQEGERKKKRPLLTCVNTHKQHLTHSFLTELIEHRKQHVFFPFILLIGTWLGSLTKKSNLKIDTRANNSGCN